MHSNIPNVTVQENGYLGESFSSHFYLTSVNYGMDRKEVEKFETYYEIYDSSVFYDPEFPFIECKKEADIGYLYCIINKENLSIKVGVSSEPVRRIREHLEFFRRYALTNPKNIVSQFTIAPVSKPSIKEIQFVDYLSRCANITQTSGESFCIEGLLSQDVINWFLEYSGSFFYSLENSLLYVEKRTGKNKSLPIYYSFKHGETRKRKPY